MGEDYLEEEEYELDIDDEEEYEEDYEATGADVKIRTSLGMDAFAMIFSFFAALAASLLIAYFVLWGVYDLRIGGVMPQKIKPEDSWKYTVIGFGCDKKLSRVYNYAIIDGGRENGLEPGLVLYIGNKDAALSNENLAMEFGEWGICLVVTEDINDSICRADVIRVKPPKKPGLSSAIKLVGSSSGSDAISQRWETQATFTDLSENLNWLLEDDPKLKARVAKWTDKYQWIVKYVEYNFSKMERKVPEK